MLYRLLYIYVLSLPLYEQECALFSMSMCLYRLGTPAAEHVWVCTVCRDPAAAVAARLLLTQSHVSVTFHTRPRVFHAYTAANFHLGQSLQLLMVFC